MPRHNDNFELSVEDLEIIEDALHREKRALSVDAPNIQASDTSPSNEVAESDDQMRQIDELLGRLHNQKVFYRPQAGAYVSG